MAKTFERPSHPPQRVPIAPEPSAACASDGMEDAQKLARRFLPDCVALWSAIAFGDCEASLWVKLQAARLLAQTAGAIPEPTPDMPQPRGDGSIHA